MSDRSAARVLAACAALVFLTIVCTPILPCIDLPEHIASATYLRRLWDGDAPTAARFAWNPATYNAGVEVFTAVLGKVLPIGLAARLFVALAPPLALFGIARSLRALQLPLARAFVAVPALLAFSFGWGFANFAMGTALSFVVLALVLEEAQSWSFRRPLIAALLSLVIATTHPMAMLLAAVLALTAGVELLIRRGISLQNVIATVRAGAPLFVGCAYDLAVLTRHLAAQAASYTTVGDTLTPPVWRKVLLFGTLNGGLYGTFLDTALAWVAAAIALYVVTRRHSALRLVSPAVAMFGLYLVIPAVFLNTHLVFQRIAQWTMFCLPFAMPALGAVREDKIARRSRWVAIASALLFPVHLAAFTIETRGLGAVLAAVPKDANVTGVVDHARLGSVHMPVLTHAAALLVPEGAALELFGFGRYLGGPIVYREGMTPAYPWPTWEHDGSGYDPASAPARAFPIVLVCAENPAENTESIVARVFRGRPAKVLARERRFLLVDTR